MPDCCDPRVPSSFPRRVLVSTLGLAPQVLTETLYCLAKSRHDAFIPNEIHIITTQEGAHRARLTLLDPSTAMLKALEDQYNITGLAKSLHEDSLHIISSAQGKALQDIDSEQDNTAAADLITSLVRDLAADEDCALHVSIAGGRKTMGFLLGYALSIFGRPQDRLSHVLVSKPFESHPKFFFPPTDPVVLHDRDNRPISTAQATVTLANIPVIYLRERLPLALLSGKANYSQTIEQAKGLFTPSTMTIDAQNRTLICDGVPVKLPPVLFALAAWIARHQKNNPSDQNGLHWQTDRWPGYAREYAAIPNLSPVLIARMEKRFSNLTATTQLETDNDRKAFFEEKLSRLRTEIKKQLGELYPKYLPVTLREPYTGVKFPLSSDTIRFK